MVNPTELVPIPHNINAGLSAARRSTMVSLLGSPRHRADGTCRAVTNEPLRSLIVTDDVGPFRVTGLKPAVTSLKRIFARVKARHPDVYALLGTAGMVCVRYISGTKVLSNHSWGSALDVSLGGKLDGLGSGRRDGKTLAGLAAIAPVFNEEGWYWGVGFSSFEDGMHFEVADETMRQWQKAGAFGEKVNRRSVRAPNLSLGDRGREVRKLQIRMKTLGYDLETDGIFGPVTYAAILDFQADNGLMPDGIVGAKTLMALHGESLPV